MPKAALPDRKEIHPKTRAVLFDLYGTLMDSNDEHVEEERRRALTRSVIPRGASPGGLPSTAIGFRLWPAALPLIDFVLEFDLPVFILLQLELALQLGDARGDEFGSSRFLGFLKGHGCPLLLLQLAVVFPEQIHS